MELLIEYLETKNLKKMWVKTKNTYSYLTVSYGPIYIYGFIQALNIFTRNE